MVVGQFHLGHLEVHMKAYLSDFFTNESGQGITEYGAILAFVAILVAVVFSITQGALSSAISKAFSSVVSQLNHLSSAAAAASS
jgi:Flp pilus assembly pilin Flp